MRNHVLCHYCNIMALTRPAFIYFTNQVTATICTVMEYLKSPMIDAVRMYTALLRICFLTSLSEAKYCSVTNSGMFPSFVTKTASLQESLSENIYSRKSRTNLPTATCHYKKEEI